MLILLCIITITLDTKYDYLNYKKKIVSTIITPIYYTAIGPKLLWDNVYDFISTKQDLIKQIENLKSENLVLETKLLKYNSVQLENNRLKELLNSTKFLNEKFLISEILDVSIDPLGKKYIINKGSSDGVYTGQSVVSSKGIVGQVTDVYKFTSVIILINDAEHAMPVENQRTGMRSLAMGLGDSLELLNVLKGSDIKVGDILVSSGIGERFPEGYPVGKVLSVEYQDKKSTLKVIVKPVVEFNILKEVLLVWNIKDDINKNFVENQQEGSKI